MGADLQIKFISGDNGYFRDSYNCYNLLWQLRLDYWNFINKMLDKNDELSVEKSKKLLKIVKDNYNYLDTTMSLMTKENKKYFSEKYQEFVSFLERAIETKSPIECSI
jgi:hypothetical protein